MPWLPLGRAKHLETESDKGMESGGRERASEHRLRPHLPSLPWGCDDSRDYDHKDRIDNVK